jgi:hypothetical protein
MQGTRKKSLEQIIYGNYLIAMAVFRIRDILIRIRILGSVHWITDPDPYPDTALFGSGFQEKKIVLFPKVFCSFLAVGRRNISL